MIVEWEMVQSAQVFHDTDLGSQLPGGSKIVVRGHVGLAVMAKLDEVMVNKFSKFPSL